MIPQSCTQARPMQLPSKLSIAATVMEPEAITHVRGQVSYGRCLTGRLTCSLNHGDGDGAVRLQHQWRALKFATPPRTQSGALRADSGDCAVSYTHLRAH